MPSPMPVIATGSVPAELATIGSTVPIENAIDLTLLPRLGTNGILADIEYAELAIGPRAGSVTTEVWLTEAAPADVLERLGRAGLIVQSDVRSSDRYALFSHQAPALALGFLRLAAVAALILAAAGLIVGAVLDRSRRSEDLRILAPQGLKPWIVHIGATAGRVWLVLLASVAGGIAAAGAWLAAREVVPVYTVELAEIPLPQWPEPIVARLMLVALGFLLVVCWVAARVARGRVEGNELS